MKNEHRKVGLAGEKAACIFLKNLGYEILDTNYQCLLGEIDIIARDQGTIVIVEVRARTSQVFGGPEESITDRKAQRLRRLALYYLKTVTRRDIPCRIDLVAVNLSKVNYSVEKVKHMRGILAE